MIDQLAAEYASRAIFIEYDVDTAIAQDRLDRWWAGSDGTSATLPLTMVDSGYLTHSGYTSLSYSQHKAMVEAALARPAQANVQATWKRVGDQVNFNIQVTNLSGAPLNNNNFAAVHALVYEDARVQFTGRFIRTHVALPIASLDNNATATYSLTTAALTGVDWSKLHFIALVDYIPPGGSGAYDMLQAAVATPPITAAPPTLRFSAPLGGPAPSAQPIQLAGVSGTTWTATKSQAWLNVTPSSGTVPATVQASITPGALPTGLHIGKLTFTGGGGETAEVTVLAAIGAVKWVYLPAVVKR